MSLKLSQQLRQDSLDVFIDVDIVHANNLVAECNQSLSAHMITGELRRITMGCSINLDNQPFFAASKINEITFDRELTNELEPSEPAITQVMPKLIFGRRSIRSQGAGTISFPWLSATHFSDFVSIALVLPLTLTLSPSERGEGIDRGYFKISRTAMSAANGIHS